LWYGRSCFGPLEPGERSEPASRETQAPSKL